jgi:predicted MFS family arabinose efflux permease
MPELREGCKLLFACVPICYTFAALGIIGLIVVITGAHHLEKIDQQSDEKTTTEPGYGPPRWWVMVLLFVVIIGHFLLIWAWTEW